MCNEFGEKLDRNGYAESVLQETERECFLCGDDRMLERHEIFGNAMREKSKGLGLWVSLCPNCHRNGKKAAHNCGETATALKRIAQQAAMDLYDWTPADWQQRFYKNYV